MIDLANLSPAQASHHPGDGIRYERRLTQVSTTANVEEPTTLNSSKKAKDVSITRPVDEPRPGNDDVQSFRRELERHLLGSCLAALIGVSCGKRRVLRYRLWTGRPQDPGAAEVEHPGFASGGKHFCHNVTGAVHIHIVIHFFRYTSLAQAPRRVADPFRSVE